MIFTTTIRCTGRIRALGRLQNLSRSYGRTVVQPSGFPASLHPSSSSRFRSSTSNPSRLKRTARGLTYLAFGLGVLYFVDSKWYASSLTRTVRTFATGVIVASDYKLNFRAHPFFAGSIADLHSRNADRIYDLLRANGGLYLKIGQAIAMQSAVLPTEFQRRFARFFDDAPSDEWRDVKKVIEEDFGRSVEEVFGVGLDREEEVFGVEEGKGVMETTARASASVAQVHWARLPDGREVAVKVQKREIRQQVGWDLWAFKVVMYIYTKLFDLPLYNMVPYISQRLLLETDFVNEANNAELMARLVENEPRLRGRVYIPKVYRELSTDRVMTAEWIEGVRLWDKDDLTKPWKGGKGGSPGSGGKPLPTASLAPKKQALDGGLLLKPERTSWRGPSLSGGLGLHLSDVMSTIVDLFSAQMFLWGVVHCDPHPGNIFIRRLPSGKPEIVLIDHGLYIRMDPTFRKEWARLWTSLLALDNEAIREISHSWGIRNADAFASTVLMKPYTGGDMSTQRALLEELAGKDEAERAFEIQRRMQGALREVLSDEEKWPQELIFLARNLRIVQGNNQFLGSPVNRIKITAVWASRALREEAIMRRGNGVWARVGAVGRYVLFRLVLLSSDLVWWVSRVRQVLGLGGGMEEDVEARIREMARGFGVELSHDLFEG